MACLVVAGGVVAGEDTHQAEQENNGSEEAAAVGGRQESKHRKEEGDDGHAQHLHAHPNRDRQQHRVRRRPEDIAVDKLPTRLLVQVIRVVELVVLGDFLLQGAHEDHRHLRAEQAMDQGEQQSEKRNHQALTMPVRKTTIMTLLMTANQWMLSSSDMYKYVSHRLAHLISGVGVHVTSYVQNTSAGLLAWSVQAPSVSYTCIFSADGKRGASGRNLKHHGVHAVEVGIAGGVRFVNNSMRDRSGDDLHSHYPRCGLVCSVICILVGVVVVGGGGGCGGGG